MIEKTVIRTSGFFRFFKKPKKLRFFKATSTALGGHQIEIFPAEVNHRCSVEIRSRHTRDIINQVLSSPVVGGWQKGSLLLMGERWKCYLWNTICGTFDEH